MSYFTVHCNVEYGNGALTGLLSRMFSNAPAQREDPAPSGSVSIPPSPPAHDDEQQGTLSNVT
jgi:hypothetical protein